MKTIKEKILEEVEKEALNLKRLILERGGLEFTFGLVGNCSDCSCCGGKDIRNAIDKYKYRELVLKRLSELVELEIGDDFQEYMVNGYTAYRVMVRQKLDL